MAQASVGPGSREIERMPSLCLSTGILMTASARRQRAHRLGE